MKKAEMRETVTHGETLFPFQIYPVNLSCGVRESHLHWHPEMEIIYVQEGAIHCQADFQNHILNEGEILLIPKGQLHNFQKVADSETKVWAFVFDLQFLSTALLERGYLKYIEPIQMETMCFQQYIQTQSNGHAVLQYHLDIMLHSYLNRPLAYELEIKSHLLLFMMQLIREGYTKHMPKVNVTKQKKIETIKDVIAYIEVNYRQPISLEQLASVANYSEFHFSRFFKQETGMTCVEYLNNYRLEQALKTLLREYRPIIEIASEHGFENVSYFIKRFKQKYKQTPAQFRNHQSTQTKLKQKNDEILTEF